MDKALGVIALLAILGYLMAHPILLGIAVVLFIAGFIFFYIKTKEQEEKQMTNAAAARSYAQTIVEVARSRIPELIETHIQTLSMKRDQTITQDDYGNYEFESWFREINYFIQSVCMKDDVVSAYIEQSPSDRTEEIFDLVMNAVQAHKEKQIESGEHLPDDIESLDPVAFEHYCKDLLITSGWNARTTKGSGDQGVDVIATMGPVKAVFQCKKYSKPVGNAAVQEIVAGKAHEQAHVAAVVTNNTYTPAAKQLAATTGVHLLHFSELPGFAERIGLVEEKEQEAPEAVRVKTEEPEQPKDPHKIVMSAPKVELGPLVAKKS